MGLLGEIRLPATCEQPYAMRMISVHFSGSSGEKSQYC